MRRLALLLAGGALWLILAASAAYADGGPHQLTLNSGTSGLNGDCAACHRAHTAQAADLLKASMPGLCTTCHNGTGATTDVVNGVQYTPDGAGNPTNAVLGALRGGGFEFALIGAPARLTYNSRGGIVVTYDGLPASGSITLAWPAFTGFAGGNLTYDPTVGPTSGQLDALFLTSTTYSASTAAKYMSSQTASNMKATNCTGTASSGCSAGFYGVIFNPQNGLRLVTVSTPTVSADTSGQNARVGNLLQANMGEASKVGVLAVADKAPVTSTHEGVGTVWGNGPQGQGNAGATGVALECTSCHNPHGNGQYRILSTVPGEDWGANPAPVEASTTLSANVTTGFGTSINVASAADFPKQKFTIKIDNEEMLVTGGMGTTTWTVVRGANSTTPDTHASGAAVSMLIEDWIEPTTAVEVVDGAPLTAGQVRNYTVLPSTNGLTTGVVGTAAQGDYFRYKFDPSGTANFTNFYLIQDPMNTGWNGNSPTNALDVGTASTTVGAGGIGGTAGDTSLLVASTTGMPSAASASTPQPVFLIKVENEVMTASFKVDTTVSPAVFVANTLSVSRGYFGTSRVAHAAGVAVDVVSSDITKNATAAQYGELYNKFGRMTAWCITCHTRYDGNRLTTAGNGAPSLNAQSPTDALFMYKHGTTGTGCEQCHVNHGSNVAMTAQFSAAYKLPDGTAEDSALLKVTNRGTCNLCHEPTHTVPAGTKVGVIPLLITPGP